MYSELYHLHFLKMMYLYHLWHVSCSSTFEEFTYMLISGSRFNLLKKAIILLDSHVENIEMLTR